MSQGFVYVVQQHFKYDRERGELVARYDLTRAQRWGKMRILLDERADIDEPRRVIAKMNMLLSTFSDDDYLLLIGHPVLIGWATAIAASHNTGRIRQLVWSGEHRDYRVVESNLPIRKLGV
jgi:hypothetical protein